MAVYKCPRCGCTVTITPKKPSITTDWVGKGVRKNKCPVCGQIFDKKKDKIKHT